MPPARSARDVRRRPPNAMSGRSTRAARVDWVSGRAQLRVALNTWPTSVRPGSGAPPSASEGHADDWTRAHVEVRWGPEELHGESCGHQRTVRVRDVQSTARGVASPEAAWPLIDRARHPPDGPGTGDRGPGARGPGAREPGGPGADRAQRVHRRGRQHLRRPRRATRPRRHPYRATRGAPGARHAPPRPPAPVRHPARAARRVRDSWARLGRGARRPPRDEPDRAARCRRARRRGGGDRRGIRASLRFEAAPCDRSGRTWTRRPGPGDEVELITSPAPELLASIPRRPTGVCRRRCQPSRLCSPGPGSPAPPPMPAKAEGGSNVVAVPDDGRGGEQGPRDTLQLPTVARVCPPRPAKRRRADTLRPLA